MMGILWIKCDQCQAAVMAGRPWVDHRDWHNQNPLPTDEEANDHEPR